MIASTSTKNGCLKANNMQRFPHFDFTMKQFDQMGLVTTCFNYLPKNLFINIVLGWSTGFSLLMRIAGDWW